MRKHELKGCPQWLLDADTENEDVCFDEFGTLVWRSGNFKGGNFKGGDFWGGNFLGGNFVSGYFWGERIDHKPISVYGLEWPIVITQVAMTIGCQTHSIKDWNDFGDERIAEMHSKAPEFWRVNRDFLLSICNYEASFPVKDSEVVK